MLEILYNLQHENYKDISPITKIHSKMHSIVYWSPPIIFIVTSNYKNYVVKFIIFLTFFYLNYLWLVTRLFVEPIYLNLTYLYL